MKVTMTRAKEIMSMLDFEEVEDGIEQLRSLESCEEITEEEYDFVLANWDNLVD